VPAVSDPFHSDQSSLSGATNYHFHQTKYTPEISQSLYYDIWALANHCGASKVVLVHLGNSGLDSQFLPQELDQVLCCDLLSEVFDKDNKFEKFHNSFLCLLCMPGHYFYYMISEFKNFARLAADKHTVELAGLGIACGGAFGLAASIWNRQEKIPKKSAFCRLCNEAIGWQISYSEQDEKHCENKAKRLGHRIKPLPERRYRRIGTAFNKEIDSLVREVVSTDLQHKEQQFDKWIEDQKEFYKNAESGTIVSYDEFFYVVFWQPFNFALVARQEIKCRVNGLIIAEFPVIFNKIKKSKSSGTGGTTPPARANRGGSGGAGGQNNQESQGDGGVRMSGVGRRVAKLWQREQDTVMQGWDSNEEYFVPHYCQPNLPGAPHSEILGSPRPIQTKLLAHCALGTTDDKNINAKIVVNEENKFYLQATKDIPKHGLVLLNYKWEREETKDFAELNDQSFINALARDSKLKGLVEEQLQSDANPGPRRKQLLVLPGDIKPRPKGNTRLPKQLKKKAPPAPTLLSGPGPMVVTRPPSTNRESPARQTVFASSSSSNNNSSV